MSRGLGKLRGPRLGLIEFALTLHKSSRRGALEPCGGYGRRGRREKKGRWGRGKKEGKIKGDGGGGEEDWEEEEEEDNQQHQMPRGAATHNHPSLASQEARLLWTVFPTAWLRPNPGVPPNHFLTCLSWFLASLPTFPQQMGARN